jgi:hypothetical protein
MSDDRPTADYIWLLLLLPPPPPASQFLFSSAARRHRVFVRRGRETSDGTKSEIARTRVLISRGPLTDRDVVVIKRSPGGGF